MFVLLKRVNIFIHASGVVLLLDVTLSDIWLPEGLKYTLMELT